MKRKMWATALAASMVISALSGITVSAEEADSDLSGTLTILSWYDETKAAPVLDAFKELQVTPEEMEDVYRKLERKGVQIQVPEEGEEALPDSDLILEDDLAWMTGGWSRRSSGGSSGTVIRMIWMRAA